VPAEFKATSQELMEAIFRGSKSEFMKSSTLAPFFIQWLNADHPAQDGKAIAAIEKITISDTDHLSDSWFKTEILGD
jgi:hypothetical protein